MQTKTTAEEDRLHTDKFADKTSKHATRLLCGVANVDGIKTKLNEFRTIINKEDLDIFCVVETFAKALDHDKLFHIPGYQTHRQDRPLGRKGGVMMYIKNNLKCEVTWKEASPSSDWEMIWCRVFCEGGNTLVGCCYKSDSNINAESHLMFLKSIKSQIERFPDDELLLTGDFNYPDIVWTGENWGECHTDPSRQFVDLLFEHGLDQLVGFETRFRQGQRPSTLDLLITHGTHHVFNLYPRHPIGKSDHIFITWSVETRRPADQMSGTRYNYKKADFKLIDLILGSIDWSDEFDGLTTCEAWEVLETNLINLIDCVVPTINKSRLSSRPGWMTKDVKSAINRKRRTWHAYRSSPSPAKWRVYTDSRNEVTSIIRRAKADFEEKLLEDSRANPKALYSYFSTKHGSDPVQCIRTCRDELVMDPKEIAKLLNMQFSNNFNKTDIHELTWTENPDLHDKAPHINTEDLEARLGKLDPAKAPGYDQISTQVLKNCSKSLSEPLAMIFNKSISEGVMPTGWKTANITPIHKGGDATCAGNYRPISLLSCVAKVLEGYMDEWLRQDIAAGSGFSECQHGFVKNKSCMTNLLKCVSDWTKNLDEGYATDVIYLDMSKAFDRVPHDVLLRKLKDRGIRFHVRQWIANYLSSRKQRVVIRGQASEFTSVTSGVPQGSLLGPTLFILFVDDISNGLSCIHVMYADDLKIYCRISCPDDMIKLQADLDRLQLWATQNKMDFNPLKTKVLRIGKYEIPPEYKLNHHQLEVVHEIKDLGIVVDHRLKFDAQCLSVARRASGLVHFFRRGLSTRSVRIARMVIKTFIRPIVDYCSQIWSPGYQKYISCIEKVQRRATKFLAGIEEMPYEERLQRLGLTTLAERRTRGDMLLMFGFCHGNYNLPYDEYLLRNPNRVTRGHQYTLLKPRVRTNAAQFAHRFRSVTYWNSLPTHVVGAQSVNSFKCLYDKLFDF